MKTTPTVLPAQPIGCARIGAGHKPTVTSNVRIFFRTGVAAWRRLRVEGRRRRERIRTEAIIANLPREIRADIGWRTRGAAE